MRVSGVRGVL
jgi:outer membrane immunogenic protein